MDRGSWWAAVHGIAKSQTQLSDFTFTFHFPALEKEMATHSSVLAWRIPGTKEPSRRPSMGSHRVGHDWSDLATAKQKFFWNSLAFLMIQHMLAIWSLVLLSFLNPALISGISRFMYYWSLAWRVLSISLLACEMSSTVVVVWTFFGIAFLWDWKENWPFPVLWPLLSFPNLLAYWV